MKRRLLSALATLTGVLATAPAFAQYQGGYTAPLVGPYLGLAFGIHDPQGSDYNGNLSNGLAGQFVAGWRVVPTFALELAADGGDSTIAGGGGTAEISDLEIDARFYPFLRPRRYRDSFVPNLILGLSPIARLRVPGSNYAGYGVIVGGGLRFEPRGTPFYFSGDLRYDILRFTSRDGTTLGSSFNGDDLQVLFGVGFRLPVFVIER